MSAKSFKHNVVITDKEKVQLKGNAESEVRLGSLTENLKTETLNLSDDEKIDIVAKRILEKHRKAFEELAK